MLEMVSRIESKISTREINDNADVSVSYLMQSLSSALSFISLVVILDSIRLTVSNMI